MPKSQIIRYSTELLFDQFLQDYIVNEDDTEETAEDALQIQTRRDGGLVLETGHQPRSFRYFLKKSIYVLFFATSYILPGTLQQNGVSWRI